MIDSVAEYPNRKRSVFNQTKLDSGRWLERVLYESTHRTGSAYALSRACPLLPHDDGFAREASLSGGSVRHGIRDAIAL